MTYEQWKQELIDVTAKETGRDKSEIKIGDAAAKEWFNDGIDPYYCFRENWNNDGD